MYKLIPADEDDLDEIVTELKDINDVEELGLKLGVRMSALESIKIDYQPLKKQKTQVIYHWLKRKDIVRQKQNERPTWGALADAIASLDPSLSARIRNKYCKNLVLSSIALHTAVCIFVLFCFGFTK